MVEIVVDSFAGGGGASLGIAWATGKAPDVSINHDEAAIEMHAANHPTTLHVKEDVWKAKMIKIIGRRKVGLLWASPDCKHFSRAKGSKPVKKEIRSLAWVVCRWAEQFKPRVIILENVREFEEWGPLVPRLACRECEWKGTEGQAKLARVHLRCPRCNAPRLKQIDEQYPDPERKGLTFKRWVGRLRNLGYKVEWRVLDAANYGAPTHRRRLFVIARRDRKPIVWPEVTHGDPKKLDAMPLFGQLKPWRTAAECIDWSIPMKSIFDRKKPLKEATLRRIAYGIKRYVLDAKTPFIVRCNHGGDHFRGQRADDPFCTVTSSSDAHGLTVPILSKYHGQKANESRCSDVVEPVNTLDTQPRFALVSAFLAKHFGGVVGVGAETPMPTTTTRGTQTQLVTANLCRMYGKSIGQSVDKPAPTETSNPHTYLIAGSLVQTGYGERDGQNPRSLDPNAPLGTVVAGGAKHAAIAANLVHFNHGQKTWGPVDEPTRSQTTVGHAALVYSFLVRYFKSGTADSVDRPIATATTKDRTALVTVDVDGEKYVISDICMRMLTPRELARAQGFPDTYILTGNKTSQTARIGNSVPPHVARALVEANFVRSEALV